MKKGARLMRFSEFIALKEELPHALLELCSTYGDMRKLLLKKYGADCAEIRSLGTKDILLVKKSGITFVYDVGRGKCSFRELRKR